MLIRDLSPASRNHFGRVEAYVGIAVEPGVCITRLAIGLERKPVCSIVVLCAPNCQAAISFAKTYCLQACDRVGSQYASPSNTSLEHLRP